MVFCLVCLILIGYGHELMYHDMGTSLDGWNVIHSKTAEIISSIECPNEYQCIRMYNYSRLTISINNTKGYGNITVLYDLKLIGFNRMDIIQDYFGFMYSCNNNPLINGRQYAPKITGLYINESIHLSNECNNVNNISLHFNMWEHCNDNCESFGAYINNVSIYGKPDNHDVHIPLTRKRFDALDDDDFTDEDIKWKYLDEAKKPETVEEGCFSDECLLVNRGSHIWYKDIIDLRGYENIQVYVDIKNMEPSSEFRLYYLCDPDKIFSLSNTTKGNGYALVRDHLPSKCDNTQIKIGLYSGQTLMDNFYVFASIIQTESPTIITKEPTNMPSINPSNYPTDIPSFLPSIDPTIEPTISPTKKPKETGLTLQTKIFIGMSTLVVVLAGIVCLLIIYYTKHSQTKKVPSNSDRNSIYGLSDTIPASQNNTTFESIKFDNNNNNDVNGEYGERDHSSSDDVYKKSDQPGSTLGLLTDETPKQQQIIELKRFKSDFENEYQ